MQTSCTFDWKLRFKAQQKGFKNRCLTKHDTFGIYWCEGYTMRASRTFMDLLVDSSASKLLAREGASSLLALEAASMLIPEWYQMYRLTKQPDPPRGENGILQR